MRLVANMISGSQLTFRVLVLSRGRWTMHLRCKAKDDHGNSCFIKVDGRSIQAPPGIKHHTGVIQTQIGSWGWFTKWRESPNIPITLDLEPGIRELTFSPREPQQLDRIVLRRGPVKGNAFGGLKGIGPDATPHVIDFPWPGVEDKELAKLVYEAYCGELYSVIRKLERKAKRGPLIQEETKLLTTCKKWIQDTIDSMESAAESGDYLTAVDNASLIQLVAEGDGRLRDISKRVKAWQKEPSYQAGVTLYRILSEKATAPEEEFIQIMDMYKERFPASPYLTAPWFFKPK